MPVITLPKMIEVPIAGCDPLVITRDDMASLDYWYRLSVKREYNLGREAFADDNTYMKYFLVTLGLLDYPHVLAWGKEGEGKSLIMAYLTHKISTLFGKRSTLDWTPPNQTLYPNRFDLNDEDFSTKILEDLNRIKRYGNDVPKEELEKCIVYNTIFGLDECDGYGDATSQTNLTKLIGKLSRRRRHFHMGIIMCYVDPNDIPVRLIWNRRTHEITCGKDAVYRGYITYNIFNRYTRVTKQLHLDPAECAEAGLWNSHNMVSVSHEVDIHFGNKKKKKVEDD